MNTDFSTKGMSATELTAVVNAWQSGAMSRDTMLDLFRRGEVLPDGRSNEEESALIRKEASRPEDRSRPRCKTLPNLRDAIHVRALREWRRLKSKTAAPPSVNKARVDGSGTTVICPRIAPLGKASEDRFTYQSPARRSLICG